MDKNGNCPLWAKDGHCQSNPGYMNTNCRHSCKVCGGRNCQLCLLRVIEPRERTGFNESVQVSYFSVRSSGSSPYPLLVTCTVVGISINFFEGAEFGLGLGETRKIETVLHLDDLTEK